MDDRTIPNEANGTFLRRYGVWIALCAIALLSFGLNFYAIGKVGFGNAYYAAAIKSMTQSWHNFFFVSFDPAGMVSVDKPPLGLWVQAAFVWVFGYHGWAMLLPQALAATGSTVLLYALVAKRFGKGAGLLSALAFALTPVVVVAARNNTMDAQLVFTLLLATWFLFRAIDTGKFRHAIIAAVLVGLGFNIKMLQAYMALPAMGVVYLVFSREAIWRRLAKCVAIVAVIAAVSFSWTLIVDATPAEQRPYVGSSSDNTVMELILGHNGMERLYGGGGGRMGGRNDGRNNNGFGGSFGDGNRMGGMPNAGNNDGGRGMRPERDGGWERNGTLADGNLADRNFPNGNFPDGNFPNGSMPGGNPPSGGNANNGGPGFGNGGFGGGGIAGNEIGRAGLLRLWQQSMFGQISWLIVFALFGIVSVVRKFRLKEPSAQQSMVWYWALWLIAMFVFFSFAGFYHRYYLCMLAPGIAALFGIGLSAMLRDWREKNGWRRWLLPAAFATTMLLQVVFVWQYEQLRSWLIPVMIGTGVLATVLLVADLIRQKKWLRIAATGALLVSLLAAPLYWSYTVMAYVSENITMPFAGPELANTGRTPGMTPNQQAKTDTQGDQLTLEKYLVAHYKEGSYLVVANRANDVADFIVDTGLPAVAYGGFLGSDNALTLDRLKELVAQGKITYFLTSSQGGMGGNSELISYVQQNATLIDPSEYGQGDSASGDRGGFGRPGGSLYLLNESV